MEDKSDFKESNNNEKYLDKENIGQIDNDNNGNIFKRTDWTTAQPVNSQWVVDVKMHRRFATTDQNLYRKTESKRFDITWSDEYQKWTIDLNTPIWLYHDYLIEQLVVAGIILTVNKDSWSSFQQYKALQQVTRFIDSYGVKLSQIVQLKGLIDVVKLNASDYKVTMKRFFLWSINTKRQFDSEKKNIDKG